METTVIQELHGRAHRKRKRPAVLDLEQSAVTLGTAKSGRLTSGFVLGRREICQSGGHLYFRHHEVKDHAIWRT